MPPLSDADVRGILGFLHEACEVEGPDAFTEPVLEAFWHLIPSDGGAACNTFAGERPGTRPETRTVYSYTEIDCDWCMRLDSYWTDELDEACRHYIDEDAMRPAPEFMSRPVRISDLLTIRAQRRRAMWHYVDRVCGTEDALFVWLPAPDERLVRRISFFSAQRGGVTERDRYVLELLTPHLVQLHRRAAERRRTASWPGDLTPREREVMRLVAYGRTNREVARALWISPHTVRTHLEHVFEKLEVTTRTAAVARIRRHAGAADVLATAPRNGSSDSAAHDELTPGATLINKHAY